MSWAVISRIEDDDGLGENREAGGTSRRRQLLQTVTVQGKRTQGNEGEQEEKGNVALPAM